VSLVVAPLALLWPAAGVAALLDGRRRAVGWAAVAVLAVAVGLLAALAVEVRGGGAVTQVAGGWPGDVGIRLRADALGALFALLSALVLLVALLHAVLAGVETRITPALTLLMALGLTGLFLTGDVFSFYVFFELAMISAYALAGVGGEARQAGAALIFAVVNLLGSFVFLIAVAALYHVTGTLEMGAVAARMAEVDPATALLIAVMFFVAFGVKLGLFPFHFWLPAVYASAPPAVAAMLAGGLANIGAYGLLRFGAELLPRELALADVGLVVVGTASIVYGSLQALSRRSTREVLAYSAIGHAGYILVALGIGGPVGLAAAVVFSVVNSLNKTLLFLIADLRGPLIGLAFAAGAFSVAGVPPSAGFFGKAALFDAGVQVGSATVVALLFVGGALSFVYLFQIYQHDHWRPAARPPEPAPRALRLLAAGLAVLVVGLGLWPEPLLALAQAGAGVLLPGSAV
jgi:multicomponent Na+:H+ antiporter subunit D